MPIHLGVNWKYILIHVPSMLLSYLLNATEFQDVNNIKVSCELIPAEEVHRA